MVECKLPKYSLGIHSTSPRWGDIWAYRIGEGSTIVRAIDGFNDFDTALEWGRRALWCLSLGD